MYFLYDEPLLKITLFMFNNFLNFQAYLDLINYILIKDFHVKIILNFYYLSFHSF